MCEELGEFRVIPCATIVSINWTTKDPDFIEILTHSYKFILSADSCVELSSALGLGNLSTLASALESVGRSEQVPLADRSQEFSELPPHGAGTHTSEPTPSYTRPLEHPHSFLWRLA